MDQHVKKHKDAKTSRDIKSKPYKNFAASKGEGHGFADKRKQRILHQYKKVIRRENKKYAGYAEKVQKIYDEVTSEDEQRPQNSATKRKSDDVRDTTTLGNREQKTSAFHKEEKRWKNKKLEKEKQTKEAELRRQAKDAALAEYQKKKRQQHKMLSRRNYKGQPNMASRMELLLEKIEKQTAKS